MSFRRFASFLFGVIALSFIVSHASASIIRVWGEIDYSQLRKINSDMAAKDIFKIKNIPTHQVICDSLNFTKCQTQSECERAQRFWWNDQCNRYSQPEIKISHEGSELVNGGSIHNFGVVETGQSGNAVTFTIENEGQLPLDLTGNPRVAVSGTDANQFSVTQPPVSSLSAAATTTFTVTFSPTGGTEITDQRTATITIENNDGDGNETSYAIDLRGLVTECSAGQYLGAGGICVPTQAGYFSPAGDNDQALCQEGYFCEGGNSSITGNGQCTAGYYCEAGSTTAQGQGQCTAGYFCPSGSTSATQSECGIGNYCAEGSPSASACPTNSTTTTATSTTINDCVGNAGWYGCTDGTCDEAAIGFYSEANSNDELACAAGSYTSTTAQSSCSTCEANFYCEGGADRVACAAGYESAAGSDELADCIDVVDPTVTDDYQSDGSWTTTDQTITLTATDNETGIAQTNYCFGASCDPTTGSTYSTPIEITTDTNDTLRYQTTDNAGNTSTIGELTVQLDKTNPVCGTWTPGVQNWGADSQPFTLADSTDAFSTIDTAGGTCTTSPIGTTCDVTITDVAGNSTTCTSPAGTADTTDPTVSDDYTSDGTWVTTNQTITLTPADAESGVANTQYCWGTTCTPSTGTTYSTPISVTTNTNDTLRYQTTDNAGNTSTIGEITVQLDKTNPVCGTWTPDPAPWTNTTPQSFTLAGSTDAYSDIATAGGSCDVNTNGQTCSVQISDNAGNTTDCTSPTANIDQTNPTAPTPAPSGADSSGTSADQNVTFGWTAASDNEAVATLTIEIDDDKTGAAVLTETLTTTDTTYTGGAGTLQWGTEYFARIIVTDTAGNSTTSAWSTTGIIPDGNPPTVTDDYANDGTWVNTNQTITLTANDAESGVDETLYCWGTSCTPNLTYTSPISITTDTDDTLRYQATDNAGNSSTIGEVSVKIDKNIPTITDNYTNDGTWVNTNQTITLTPSDTGGSGLDTTTYCWGAACNLTTGTTYTAPISVTTDTDDILRYQTTDNAGNSSTIGTIDVKINKTIPTIALTGSTPTTLTQGDSYTEQGAVCSDDIDANKAATVGGDSVTPNTIGTYTVTYDCTDSAGNAATQVTRTVNVNGCDAGQYWNGSICTDVGIGYYSPVDDSTRTACPAGQTTTITNADASNDCVNEQEINLKQNTTDIASGGSYDFGTIATAASSSAITFTIENTGQVDLALSGSPKIAISGANAGEFSIDQASTTATVAGQSSTTFDVTFSPTTDGAKTATISIANNDTDENPYTFSVTGTGEIPLPEYVGPSVTVSQDPTCTPGASDFTLVTNAQIGGITNFYHETKCMGLKWATADQTSAAWATSTSYTEPTWDGASYNYPSGRVATDYPAFKHCTDLGPGWRLPTHLELAAIIDSTKTSPATNLPSAVSTRYWSATEYAGNTSYAWRVLLSNGYVYSTSKTTSYRVVCVSD